MARGDNARRSGRRARWARQGLGLALLLVLLAGCTLWGRGREAGRAEEPQSVEELRQSLVAAGADARLGESSVRAEGVSAHILWVGDQQLTVYAIQQGQSAEDFAHQLLAEAGGGARIRIWTEGSLVVEYRENDGPTVVLMNGLLGDPVSPPTSGEEGPYPPAVTAAIEAVAEAEDQPPEEVEVEAYRPRLWSDDCLELGEPGEDCPASQIGGWSVQLTVEGRTIEAHTDRTGANVRMR